MKSNCARCKQKISVNSNSQKYCKDCAYIVQLEKKRKYIAAKRKKEEGLFGPRPIRKKDGTINFNAEKKAIQKEMERLGLRI